MGWDLLPNMTVSVYKKCLLHPGTELVQADWASYCEKHISQTRKFHEKNPLFISGSPVSGW